MENKRFLTAQDAQTFGIKISTGKNRQFEIVFCKEKQCCFVDRTTTGVNPHDKFAGKYKAPVDFTQEFLTIKLLMFLRAF